MAGAPEWVASRWGEATEGVEAGRGDVCGGRAWGQGSDWRGSGDTARRVGQLHWQSAEDQGSLGGGHRQSKYTALLTVKWL